MLQSVGLGAKCKSLITWFSTGLLARPKIGSSGETCAFFLPEKLRLKKDGFSRNVRDKLHITVVTQDEVHYPTHIFYFIRQSSWHVDIWRLFQGHYVSQKIFRGHLVRVN
jgi:hypothetical protein